MNDDVEVYFESEIQNCYLESLIKSRRFLADAPYLIKKLEEVIDLELDLAMMGAQKAKSEVLKTQPKDNLRPIK